MQSDPDKAAALMAEMAEQWNVMAKGLKGVGELTDFWAQRVSGLDAEVYAMLFVDAGAVQGNIVGALRVEKVLLETVERLRLLRHALARKEAIRSGVVS